MLQTKVLAFLQNTQVYPHHVARWRKLMESPRRHEYLWSGLFAGCKTGVVLKRAGFPNFPDVIWENASTEIGCSASSCYPADPHHMVAQINRFEPELVLAFGNIAAQGLSLLDLTNCEVMIGPHPAARFNVMPRLIEMANKARSFYDV